MVYKPSDIKHLEVLANLDAQEAKQSEPINLVLFDTIPYEQTLDEQILSLCSKLTSSGFARQADSLEHKFLAYKKADAHLYRAIDEDGEDLIDAAHPDGEVEIVDASGDLGKVETLVTEHRKIVDMVQREPSGKLGKYIDRVNKVINKKAVFPFIPVNIWNNTKDSELNQSLQINGEQFISRLNGIKDNEILSSQSTKIDNLINELTVLLNKNTEYKEMKIRGLENKKDYGFIIEFKKLCEEIKIDTSRILETINEAISQDEEGYLNKFYRKVVFKSNLVAAKQSLNGFVKALKDVIGELNRFERTDVSNEKSSKDLAVSRLKLLFVSVGQNSKISDSKKQQAKNWIKSQIAEISISEDSKLSELVNEIDDFERQLKVLEGK